MNFACDRCQKPYSIADEKVQGRGFRVTCRQCGQVIVVPASGQPAPAPAVPAAGRPPAGRPPPPTLVRSAPAQGPSRTVPPPAPTPAPAGTASPRPSVERTPAPAEPRLDGRAGPPLRQGDEHESFFATPPEERPRVTAEYLLQSRRRHPALFVWVVGLAGLAVAAAVGVSIWTGQRPQGSWPPPASLTSRPRSPPLPPSTSPEAEHEVEVPGPVEPARAALRRRTPELVATAAELPPEEPLAQRGTAAPRGVGGQAGFAAASPGGDADVRERLRKRNLTIGRKDRRLLDLLDKKADAPTTRPEEQADLDTGRAALDATAIRQTLAAAGPGFGACVTRALKETPGLRVDDRRATLMLSIRPSGVVAKAWIAEAELERLSLGKCLAGVARRMTFPAFSGEALEVAAPLALSAVR